MLIDDELYAAAHIAALGLEQGVWNDEPDPEQAAKTFRMNLAKIAAKLPDEPDGYPEVPKTRPHCSMARLALEKDG